MAGNKDSKTTARSNTPSKDKGRRCGSSTKPQQIELTGHDIQLIEAGEDIATNLPEGSHMAFTHAVLCQVGLPRSKFDGREFMRQSGDAWINVQAGWLDEGHGPIEQPVPYGPLPRLALAWVSTFAIRHKTREIPIVQQSSYGLWAWIVMGGVVT